MNCLKNKYILIQAIYFFNLYSLDIDTLRARADHFESEIKISWECFLLEHNKAVKMLQKPCCCNLIGAIMSAIEASETYLLIFQNLQHDEDFDKAKSNYELANKDYKSLKEDYKGDIAACWKDKLASLKKIFEET